MKKYAGAYEFDEHGINSDAFIEVDYVDKLAKEMMEEKKMREKLIELLQDSYEDVNLIYYDLDDLTDSMSGCSEYMADYLLKNGVVVLPCNIGDDVWTLSLDKYCITGEKTGWTHKIEHWSFKYRLLDSYEFGKTLFLTKEEAEKAILDYIEE